jgi:hypothetical protein
MRSKVWIASSNITMFREKLSAETDAQRRRVLADLLAKEQQKLVDLKVEES